ncbi:UNVERIFIED_CONTAM: hypothetical protein Slati_4199300 [Sesamum latifolium]|uniref:Uncharacterized protein n=1 Tax=Sesamum latifolium TaxID=2727402 RepID=A0AAW2TAE6_9LAMI
MSSSDLPHDNPVRRRGESASGRGSRGGLDRPAGRGVALDQQAGQGAVLNQSAGRGMVFDQQASRGAALGQPGRGGRPDRVWSRRAPRPGCRSRFTLRPGECSGRHTSAL